MELLIDEIISFLINYVEFQRKSLKLQRMVIYRYYFVDKEFNLFSGNSQISKRWVKQIKIYLESAVQGTSGC